MPGTPQVCQRYTPDSTGPNDRYLDKNADPVHDG